MSAFPRPQKSGGIALIAVIIILAAFLRFYKITETPPGLWPDEAVNGVNALEALRTRDFKIFYPENNGREGLFINLQALAVKIFGPEAWALRVVSAILGTLTVLGLYLVTKELLYNPPQIQSSKSKSQNESSKFKNLPMKWVSKILHFAFCIFNSGNEKRRTTDNEIIALLSAFLLAASFWHINFSRIGFRAIAVPFFASFGIYWLLKAIRTGKISSAVLGGIFTGLGFHTYIAFRFMPFVIAVPIVRALADWFSQPSQHPKVSVPIGRPIDTDDNRGQSTPSCIPCVVALYLFITFVAALPIGFYFLKHPEDFASRSGPISIFAAESPPKEFIKSSIITLGMFNVVGDCNPRHNFFCRPELYWPVGIFFIIGLATTVRAALKSEARSAKYETNHNTQTDHVSNFKHSNLLRNSKFEFRIPRSQSWLLLAWFIFMTLPSTLTREGLPHALRAIGTIPPVFIFSGIGAWRTWQWIKYKTIGTLENYIGASPSRNHLNPRLTRIRRELTLLALAVLLWVATTETVNYFLRWAPSRKVAAAFEENKTELANYILTIPAETPVYVVVNEPSLMINGISLNAQPVVFLTNSRPNTFFVTPETLDNIPAYLGRGVIAALHTDRDLLKELGRRYPDGKVRPFSGEILPFVIPR